MYGITDMLQNRKKNILITTAIMIVIGFICGRIGYFMTAGKEYDVQEDALKQWFMECAGGSSGENILGLAVPDTQEMFYIDLSSERQSTISYLRGNAFNVNGWTNCDRGFFDGSVDLGESDIYLINFATMEYRLLEEELRSFFLGDYYVSCWYVGEHSRMELLIFFCPEK